jgi:hypothetical protein
MLSLAIIVICLAVIAYAVVARIRRAKFDAEETARIKAARKRWSKWLEGDGPEPPHDETWVEYQERKRR